MMSNATYAAPPRGLIIDLATPLTAAGDLDQASLARLLQRLRPHAQGLWAGSPLMGEGLGLSGVQRQELFAALLGGLSAPLPLFFSITGPDEAETRRLAQFIYSESGRRSYPGPVFLADLPLWYRSNRGLPQWYASLGGEVPLPLVLLNLPQVVGRRAPRFKHRNLRTHVFKKLTANPALVGLIYQGDVRRLLHYHQAAADRPELAFYEASEAGFLHRPGAWGVISAGAQLDPQTWAQLTQACLHPELTETLEDRQLLWDKSSRLLKLAELCQPAPPALLKAALAAQGIFACEATAPDTPPAPAALREQFLQAVR